MLHYCYPFEWSLKSGIWILYKMMCKWLWWLYAFEVCDCALSKHWTIENQAVHFHHHHQACLIHYYGRKQMPLLMHMIQHRIQVRPGYFINRIRVAWLRWNVTWLTQITWPGLNPDVCTYIQTYQKTLHTYIHTCIHADIDRWPDLYTHYVCTYIHSYMLILGHLFNIRYPAGMYSSYCTH